MQNTTRTALRLLVATPLAAGAIALGGFTDLAHAETPGFEPTTGGTISLPGDDEDPRPEGPGEIALPDDDEDPRPEGPGDITNPEDEDEPGPQIPGDKDGPNPGEGPGDGPDDKDGPNPGDTPEDVPGDEPADVPADVPADQGKNDQGTNDVADEVVVPNRIDAGAGPALTTGTDAQDMTLAWSLAGGGLVLAAGSLLARQRVARRES